LSISSTGTTDYLAYTGLGYGLIGQVAQGLALVNEALNSLENSNDRHAEALIRQIKGELLLMQDLLEAEVVIV